VLGSVLLDPRLLDEMATIVRPDDFYADANQRIFRRLEAMHDAGRRIDIALLIEDLKRVSEYEAVGGAAYLAEVVHSVPYAHNAPYYAEIVRERAHRRCLIHAATETLRDAWDPCSEVPDILERAEAALSAITTAQHRETIVTAEQAAVQFVEYVDQSRARRDQVGIFTGLQKFDETVGGLFPGELIILAARPSVGKSALACQIAEHNARRGRVVYLASLEMAARELAGRIICGLARVSGRKIRTGTLADEDYAALGDWCNDFARLPVLFDDRPALTVGEIRRTCRRLMRKGLSMVIIDYLQLITPDDRREIREQQVAKMARALKQLSRELRLPVLCLAQLNRQNDKESRRPRLSDLRESGAIEQDADDVMFLHPMKTYDQQQEERRNGFKQGHDTELIVAKQRNGETPTFKLEWFPEVTRFEDYSEAADVARNNPAAGDFSEYQRAF